MLETLARDHHIELAVRPHRSVLVSETNVVHTLSRDGVDADVNASVLEMLPYRAVDVPAADLQDAALEVVGTSDLARSNVLMNFRMQRAPFPFARPGRWRD